LFAAAIIIFQYKAAINYVSNHTYLSSDDADVTNKVADSEKQEEPELKRIPIGFFASIKLSFQRLLPFLCCKCCVNRRDRLSHSADKMVKEELKIVKWIQFMRITEFALQKLFTKQEWTEIEESAKFKKIQFDEFSAKGVSLIKAGSKESKSTKDDESILMQSNKKTESGVVNANLSDFSMTEDVQN
jgi:hypothetical protein